MKQLETLDKETIVSMLSIQIDMGINMIISHKTIDIEEEKAVTKEKPKVIKKF